MRKWFLYIIILLLLAGTVASWQWGESAEKRQQAMVRQVREAVIRLEREVRVRSATGQITVNGRGWAETIDPAWFSNDPPVNPLMPANRPWLEVASEGEQLLTDPPIRQSVDKNTPGFWYNPATGRVRARVGPMVSDEAAVWLYNAVNSSSVAVLFDATRPESLLASMSPDYVRLLEEPKEEERAKIVVRRQPFMPGMKAPPGAPPGAHPGAPPGPPVPFHASLERHPGEAPGSGVLMGPPAPDRLADGASPSGDAGSADDEP